jgi:primosomal protein N' (replication factor Y)
MSDYVKAAQSGATKLLVGTQMLAKGHHFPNVSLVVILDIDGALFSSDFRAQERAAQLITQVAGRAGRGDIEGQVIIQTHHPEHSLLHDLKHKSYPELAKRLLQERHEAGLPPCSYLALFRAESHHKQWAIDFLQQVSLMLNPYQEQLEILGPVACTVSRKAGRFRFQLLLNSVHRALLHQAISTILPAIESSKLASRVRWSLDIDAQDLL